MGNFTDVEFAVTFILYGLTSFAVRETTDGNVTVIEGITVESPRKNYLLQPTDSSRCCCLCRYNLDLQHTVSDKFTKDYQKIEFKGDHFTDRKGRKVRSNRPLTVSLRHCYQNDICSWQIIENV